MPKGEWELQEWLKSNAVTLVFIGFSVQGKEGPGWRVLTWLLGLSSS